VRRPKDEREGAPELVPLELVDRCRAGDEAAWAQLVGATYKEVYSLCMRILRDPDDAAEATQDAYLKAWRGLKGFRGDAMFTTWLYRVTANAAISKQRSRARRRARELGSEEEKLEQMPTSTTTEEVAGARLELRAVESAVAGLPELYRSAILLRDVYGLSIREMASELGISETAAKVRLHRGRKRLHDVLYQDGERR
jgi:RNA polymerase sigma-70 factor (ECF subfamily)